MRISVILIFNILIMHALGVLRWENQKPWQKWTAVCVLFAAAMLAELCVNIGGHFMLHVSSCLILAFAILLWRKGEGICVLAAAALSGVIAWKAADLFPLFWGTSLVQAVAVLLFALMYCKESSARLLAIVLAPMVSGICYLFSDYFLFRYFFVHIGGREMMDVQIISAFLLALLEKVQGLAGARVPRKKLRLHQ